jgi:predicted RNase H-like HicB family nuclease
MKNYIAILVPEAEGGYSVLFPDLAGCVTQGDDMTEAQAMAADALSGYLASMAEYGDPIPEPRSLEAIKADRTFAKENEIDWRDVTAVLIPVLPPLGKPERVNVSLDSNRLRSIDAYAERRGMTRSAVLEAGAELLLATDRLPVGAGRDSIDPVARVAARMSGMREDAGPAYMADTRSTFGFNFSAVVNGHKIKIDTPQGALNFLDEYVSRRDRGKSYTAVRTAIETAQKSRDLTDLRKARKLMKDFVADRFG